MKKYTVIDLFCGAGGLSEGFHQTGYFDFLAHVEWEKPMVETLRNNLIKRWGYSEDKAKKLLSCLIFKKQKNCLMVIGLKVLLKFMGIIIIL